MRRKTKNEVVVNIVFELGADVEFSGIGGFIPFPAPSPPWIGVVVVGAATFGIAVGVVTVVFVFVFVFVTPAPAVIHSHYKELKPSKQI